MYKKNDRMGSPKRGSPLWLWWRRQSFYLRRFPYCKCIFFWCFIVVLCRNIPNPFSSYYKSIKPDQDVDWSSISELIDTKQKALDDDDLSKKVKVIHVGNKERQQLEPLLILLYTTVFLNKKYCIYPIDKTFGKTCPSRHRCKWTCDFRRLHEADAVLFHAYDIQFYGSRIPNRTSSKPGAIWILWSDEPPSMVDYDLFREYKFNWTLSYKLNSEISIGCYGLFRKRDLAWSDADYNRWIWDQFNNRSKTALWFVSNCKSQERLSLYEKLRSQHGISVEGYGRCVDSLPVHICRVNSACERDYMAEFKFYLSFESIKCRDYITEKFYKAYYHGMIPIVHGPTRHDYNQLAPADSYIHVNDFDKDMTKLAKHLQEIEKNFNLYSMFHQWRKKYDVVVDGRALERVRLCELCERLARTRADSVTYYENIVEFYNERC